MKADVEMPAEAAADSSRTKSYFGRFVRKQGQYGSVAVVGSVSGTEVEHIANPKKLFAKDGMVETHGVTQHAGLSPGDWVEFNVARNTRPRAAEYKVVRLRRIPRYTELREGGDAFYRALLTREGWRGDRRQGLWALRLSKDRVVIVDLEMGKDGALRIPRTAARSIPYYGYSNDAVVRLTAGSSADDTYFGLAAEPLGHFDWSDEADYLARVIRALADADDPRVSDLIAWLELHKEAGTGKIFAAGVDHGAALDALRSGELAERLRADRDLMKVYLDAAMGDEAVAAAVADYAREGHTEARARLFAELEDELGLRRTQLAAEHDANLAAQRAAAVAALDEEIGKLRVGGLAEVEGALKLAQQRHADSLAQLDSDHQQHRRYLEQQLQVAQAELAEVKWAITDTASALEAARADVETEQGRVRDATAELDRLLSASERLSVVPATANQALLSAIPFVFPDRETVPVTAISRSIDSLAMFSTKGRDLLRRLVVLTLSGELPILYGADALDFARVAGEVLSPGRTGIMRADPTFMSIEDVWARPGSGVPTIMAAASAASATGGSVLIAVTDVERSGTRFWVPALADLLRSPARPRGLLVFAVAGDIEHDEIKALSEDHALLEVEGAFEPGAFFGALALPTVAGTAQYVLEAGTIPFGLDVAAKAVSALGFEPGIGLAMRVARIAAEAATMLEDDAAAQRLTVAIAQAIHNQTR